MMVEFHVTFADIDSARRLARAALEARLAACANLVPGVASLYWWQGRIEEETEVLAILKTSRHKADDLAAFVAANHPYETPAIIRHGDVSANAGYERWIEEETGSR